LWRSTAGSPVCTAVMRSASRLPASELTFPSSTSSGLQTGK
jgi:hypothetical protein